MKSRYLFILVILVSLAPVVYGQTSTPLPSDDNYPGYVDLKGGIRVTGSVSLATWDQNPELSYWTKKKKWERNLYPKKTIYLQLEKGKPSTVYNAPDATGAGQLVNGVMIKYTPYRTDFGFDMKYDDMHRMVPDLVHMPTLIECNAWIAQLEKDPGKLGYGSLADGEIIYKNDSVRRGRIAVEEMQMQFMFIDEQKDLTYSPGLESVKALKINTAGNPQILVRILKSSGWQFVKSDEFLQDLEKKKTLMKGNFVLKDGRKMEGRVSFYRTFNALKSYRVPLGLYFVPDGAGAYMEYFAAEEFDYVEQSEDGKTVRYVPITNDLLGVSVLMKSDELLTTLESGKSKDKTKVLQPGYVLFADGRKSEGRVAQGNDAVFLVSGANKIDRYPAYSPEVKFFIQTIDGVDRKFIRLEHGQRAFSGKGFEFVEVMQPGGSYSYYVNPAPTHIRKGVTKLVTSTITAATDVARTSLATEAAKQQIKKDYSGTDGNLGDVANATSDAADAMQSSLEATQGLVDFDQDGGLHFKEWIVVNNKTGDQTVVYARNATAEMNRLLSSCSKFASLEKKESSRLTDIKNIDEGVRFLNGCDR